MCPTPIFRENREIKMLIVALLTSRHALKASFLCAWACVCVHHQEQARKQCTTVFSSGVGAHWTSELHCCSCTPPYARPNPCPPLPLKAPNQAPPRSPSPDHLPYP